MIDDKKEYIIASAIHYDDGCFHHHQGNYNIGTGFVVGCFRHACCPFPMNPGCDTFPFGDNVKVSSGFITSYGRYVEREEAATIAIECGQIKAGELYGTNLYSEDVFKYQRYRS